MKVGEALELSHRHLSRLLAFLDANGYGQTDETVRAAREFMRGYTDYVRSRRCCANCVFCRQDDGALHVGRVDDPPVCTYEEDVEGGRAIYISGDLTETGGYCRRFTRKYGVPRKENEE